jgi:AmiR/NasT family two-component response regulator
MSGSETYRRTKVVLVHPRDTDGERVARSLINLGCRVDFVWPPNNDLPADTNLVFFLLDQRTRRWMLSLIGRERFGVIAILEQEPATAEMLLEDSNPHAVVVKPIRPLDVLTSMVVARSISQ